MLGIPPSSMHRLETRTPHQQSSNSLHTSYLNKNPQADPMPFKLRPIKKSKKSLEIYLNKDVWVITQNIVLK
jgi:hypothetical protein